MYQHPQMRHSNQDNVPGRPVVLIRAAAHRRYSCEDIGQGDHQGWLYYRNRSKSIFGHGSSWVRKWCVVKQRQFFIFKNDEKGCKADTVISMKSFKVAEAPFLKSKEFAFRIYNSGTEFLFASDSERDMKRWIHDAENASLSVHDHMEDIKEYQEFDSDESEKDPFDDPDDSLRVLTRNIKDSSVTIDGSDKTRRRRTVISGTWKLSAKDEQEQRFLELGSQLQSVQRTLKDKEMELEKVENDLVTFLRGRKLDHLNEHIISLYLRDKTVKASTDE